MNVLRLNQRATAITLLESYTPQLDIERITGTDRNTVRI
jgi:hypothetical protein